MTSPSVRYPFTLLRGIRKLCANSSRVFQPFQFNVLVAARLSRFYWWRFFHMRGGGCLGGFLLDIRYCKAWFQIIEVNHLPLTTFSLFPPLLVNAIGNTRQGPHNPPRTTPGLEKFPTSHPGSAFVPHYTRSPTRNC